jgi:hypothetical protein
LVLLAAIAGYTAWTGVSYETLGQDVGYYVAPPAGGLATFLMALWVARGLKAGFVSNGLMIGVVGVVLSVGLIFTARPEDRIMYGVSFALRILGGYAGGLVAQRSGLPLVSS